MKEAGVRVTKLHNARRFFVSTWLANNGNPEQLRKLVGHATADMTAVYHVMPDDLGSIATILSV